MLGFLPCTCGVDGWRMAHVHVCWHLFYVFCFVHLDCLLMILGNILVVFFPGVVDGLRCTCSLILLFTLVFLLVRGSPTRPRHAASLKAGNASRNQGGGAVFLVDIFCFACVGYQADSTRGDPELRTQSRLERNGRYSSFSRFHMRHAVELWTLRFVRIYCS